MLEPLEIFATIFCQPKWTRCKPFGVPSRPCVLIQPDQCSLATRVWLSSSLCLFIRVSCEQLFRLSSSSALDPSGFFSAFSCSDRGDWGVLLIWQNVFGRDTPTTVRESCPMQTRSSLHQRSPQLLQLINCNATLDLCFWTAIARNQSYKVSSYTYGSTNFAPRNLGHCRYVRFALLVLKGCIALFATRCSNNLLEII